MIIQRPRYMKKLISGMGTNQVKVVTGVRRCGKSFLVFKLFKDYLLSNGVPESNIIEMEFDKFGNRDYRDSDTFYQYAISRLNALNGKVFILLDEVQLLDNFSEILIDLIGRDGVDVYVTGSNAKLLSKDVVTEFRGRGQEIQVGPLSFSEFMTAYDGDVWDGYAEYITYGGLPAILSCEDSEGKVDYLSSLYRELYVRDIVERNNVRDSRNVEELLDVLSSAVGSLTNASKISDTFKSNKRASLSPGTIEIYIEYLEDSFLVRRAKRYDLKGRHYIGTPYKFYFSDLGLRNVRMNFRQVEETHLMENVVYNELIFRNFGVDVGVVPIVEKSSDGKQHRKQLEIDFICNKGSKRYYIQSTFALPTLEKQDQEERPLLKVNDGFKKIIITKDGIGPHYNENGILMMNIYDFLLDEDSLSF